jgi:hypothetical protein
VDEDVRRGADVYPVAGEDVVARLHRAAGAGRALEDRHAPSGARQIRGGDQCVVPGADDRDVDLRHPAPSIPG